MNDISLEKNILGLSERDLERFLAKIIRGSKEECWIWTGKPDSKGYGHFGISAWPYQAHRIAYQLAIGPIPEGRQVHHNCDIRNCVNPHHLEALTVVEHIDKTSGHPKNLTHCKRGHEFTKENTALYKGIRRCKACTSYRQRRKANPECDVDPLRVSPLYCENGHPLFGPNMTLYDLPTGGVRRLCKACRRAAVHRHEAANHELVLTQRKARRKAEKLKFAQERLQSIKDALADAGVADTDAVLSKLRRVL
jgi:hypothetical protein